MKYVLITGGAGNLGSQLAQSLLSKGTYHVTIIDNLLTGSKKNLPTQNAENFRFIKGDVNRYNDISEVMLSRQFDYVFHYAAVVGVQRTLQNPLLVLEDIEGIKNVLSLSKNTSVSRIFFSSSSEVYGEPVEIPQHEETTPLNSKLPYAVVKNLAEAYIKSYKAEFNLDYTIFRFFNTYGPYQSTDFVVPRFIEQAKRGDDITIYGEGDQTRTFCYIEDNLQVINMILEQGLHINETINIGSDEEVTILDLAQKVIKHANSNSKIVHLPKLEEGDMTRRCPDITKMKNILLADLITVEEGIKRMLSFTENIP